METVIQEEEERLEEEARLEEDAKFEAIIKGNHNLWHNLAIIESFKLKNWYLAGGCISQFVWNYMSNQDLNHGILDYDIVYHDPEDLTENTEKSIQRKLNNFLKNAPPVQVKNQARVHLWYEQKFGKKINPYPSSETAIEQWMSTTNSIGIRRERNKLIVFKTFNLSDTFAGIIRPSNKSIVSNEIFLKKSQRWQSVWPHLKIIYS